MWAGEEQGHQLLENIQIIIDGVVIILLVQGNDIFDVCTAVKGRDAVINIGEAGLGYNSDAAILLGGFDFHNGPKHFMNCGHTGDMLIIVAHNKIVLGVAF